MSRSELERARWVLELKMPRSRLFLLPFPWRFQQMLGLAAKYLPAGLYGSDGSAIFFILLLLAISKICCKLGSLAQEMADD